MRQGVLPKRSWDKSVQTWSFSVEIRDREKTEVRISGLRCVMLDEIENKEQSPIAKTEHLDT